MNRGSDTCVLPLSVGFWGAGQMATALAAAWAKAGLLDIEKSRAADPLPEARQKFHTTTGIVAVEANDAVVEACEVLIVAVKPQVVEAVLTEVRTRIRPQQLVISIAAGVPLDRLAAHLGSAVRLIRVMPNTPCLVGASATAYTPAATATAADVEVVEKLFQTVGVVVRVPEQWLDAVTGLSGSGPAFAYLFIEALADGGVHCGLPRSIALTLAAQTVLGAAKMVLESGQHPAALKDAVASPAGTTIAGLHALERAAFRAAAMDAVVAATRRAHELGQTSGISR
ncbi:MAG: pyrroline-5-carboxylate reductase [Gemmataceae bacterium]|nr:pyrroline-5-carboxylate reductase [Gemmata sp.]MDW8197820.1 pyrroline-5-carboxylate reductase [Gemmataceae bacterium]